MRYRRPMVVLVAVALLALAACGSGGGASPQTLAASPPGIRVAPSATTPASASPVAETCRRTDDPGVVAVSIADFEFEPASISAKVGQVVAFSVTGFEPHNATVEAGCGTRTLQTGESDGLVFRVPGSYRFGCTVHAWMTGTFTIAP
jgi:plastocyanin